MKKILFLTYFYAPYNITGSFRISRFIKYLSRSGIKPYIITATHNNLKISNDLYNEIPSSAHIIKKTDIIERYQSNGTQLVRNPSKGNLISKIRLLIKDLLFSPDIQIIWSLSIISKACKIVKREKIKYLFVNGGPFSLFIAGTIIKKITGVNLILDFRDPWLNNPTQLNQSFIRQIFNRFLERYCLRNSYLTISVNDLIINDLRKQYPKGRYINIPNSIDIEEFANFKVVSRVPSKFIIGYAGKIDINNDSYNPSTLLDGYKKFILNNKQKKGIVLRLYGDINLTTKKYIEDLNISSNLDLMGYCTKENVLKGLSDCDAYVQFHYPNKLHKALSIKIFEYSYFNKPILSINTKSGVLSDFINNSRIGYVCENDDIKDITRHFQKIFSLNLNEFEKNINSEYLERYSIKNQISTLLEIFK